MSVGNIVRRLTGAVKNAVVWGATWSSLAFVTILGLRAVGVVVPPEIGVLDALGMAIRVGIVGGLTGGVFAGFVSLFYRGRRLSQINPVRFGVAGAVVAELFMIAWFTLGNMASGGEFPALGDIRRPGPRRGVRLRGRRRVDVAGPARRRPARSQRG